jgi:uncharacterized protein
LKVVRENSVHIIAVGNGTASRETEELVAEVIQENNLPLEYIIVSEAGASFYSASPLARRNFLNLTFLYAARYPSLADYRTPWLSLSRLIPSPIGVVQYQHDIQPKVLEGSLGGVVESCVNTSVLI